MIRPAIIILLLLLVFSFSGFSQASKIDSLKNVLTTLPEDTARVDLLNRLGRALLRNEFENAMTYTSEAVLLSQQLDYPHGYAEALRNRADLYGTSGLYDQATSDALAALDLYEEQKDSFGLAGAYISLGVVSFYLKETDQSIEYYNHALQIDSAVGDKRGILSVRNNIASALASAGRFDEALEFFLLNLEAFYEIPTPRLKGITLNNLGAIYQEKGETEKALGYFIMAEELYQDGNDYVGLAGVYQNLAEANLLLGNLNEAERYTDISEKVAKTSGSPIRQMEILNFRSKLLEKRGRYKEAFTLYKDYIEEKRAFDQKGQVEKVGKLRAAFEADKKLLEVTRERDLVAVQAGTQRLQLNAFIGGFVLLLVIAFLQLRNNRARKKINLELRKQKAEIEEKNTSLEEARGEILRMNEKLQASNVNLEATVEKRTEELSVANNDLVTANESLDTFIYRASHDLRGPISRLKGLAQIARTQPDPIETAGYVDLMNVAADRMDQVLRKLILVREIPRLEHSTEKIDMPELIHEVQGTLLGLEDFGSFDIKLDKGNTGFLFSDRKRVRIVLENILENAYIFRKNKAQKKAEAEVLFHLSGGYFFIEIEDHGIGIDPGHQAKVFDLFFRGSPRSVGNGVGLYLVDEAINTMGGNLSFQSELGKYTRFKIGFKDHGA